MAPRNLLDLPQETINHVLSFVVPHTPIESVRSLKHQLCHLSPDSWRQDAMSLRLTCRYLSDVVAPSLFHDIYLYPMDFSFEQLTELSRSPHLRAAVKRIVLMRPQFEERLRGLREYQQARELGMQKEFAKCFRAIMGPADLVDETLPMHLSSGFLCEFTASKTTRNIVAKEGLNPLLKPGHDSYLKGLDEQKKLLDSEQYVYQGALLINKFPNLTSFVLSGGDGVKEGINWQHPALQDLEQSKSSRPKNFLETRFPLVRLDRQSHSSWPFAAEQAFVAAVMQMLSHVEVPIAELLFPTDLGVYPSVQQSKPSFWNALPLQNLKKLELYVDLKKFRTPAEAVVRIDTFLGAALAKAKMSLESLSLRTGCLCCWNYTESLGVEATSIFNNIWPSLKEITLVDLVVITPPMDRFLEHNRSIKNFNMNNVWLSRDVWRRIFTRVRGGEGAWLEARQCYTPVPTAKDETMMGLQFTVGLRDPDDERDFWSKVIHVDGHVRCCVDLKEFLAGRGEWTDGLKSYFGVLDTDS